MLSDCNEDEAETRGHANLSFAEEMMMRQQARQAIIKKNKARAGTLHAFQASRASKVSCLVIISLALWAGGLGCIFCCAINLSGACCSIAAEAPSAVVTDKESGSKDCSAEHSCCSQEKSAGEKAFAQSYPNKLGAGRCCMLAGRADAPAALPESLGGRASLEHEGEPLTAPSDSPDFLRNFASLSVRDRGSTYLQCCALLI